MMRGKVGHRFADRVAETAAALLGAAALILLLAGAREGGPGLSDARPSPIPPDAQKEFLTRLDAARVMVDGNQESEHALESLKGAFRGRHEVWALSARHMESRGKNGQALLDYAYAVRLEPAYLDEGSPLYMGDRIGRLVEGELDALTLTRSKFDAHLTEEQAGRLKAAYFLKRRLAGGCE